MLPLSDGPSNPRRSSDENGAHPPPLAYLRRHSLIVDVAVWANEPLPLLLIGIAITRGFWTEQKRDRSGLLCQRCGCSGVANVPSQVHGSV